MKKYTAPEFDVTAYEVEDIITISIGTDPDLGDGGDAGWVPID